MKIVFIGASRFGLLCLDKVYNLEFCEVVGVVTSSQTFSISYKPGGVTNVLYASFSDYCVKRQIPCFTISNGMKDDCLFNWVAGLNPNVFLVVGWYYIIPKRFRFLAPAYGLHASLLPKYSGGAPLVWAIINGESETGITLFQMDDGIDSGPIVSQSAEPIYPDDTIATLYARIEQRGLELLEKAIPLMVNDTLEIHPQECYNREVMPQRSPKDGCIAWTQDAAVIDRFIRAQTKPYPGAFTKLNGAKLIIWSGELKTDSGEDYCSTVPGTVLKQSSSYLVACGQGYIKLKEVNYKTQNYTEDDLSKLLRGGGQRLGV